LNISARCYSFLVSLHQSRKLARIKRDNGHLDRVRSLLKCGYEIDLRLSDHIAQRLLLSGNYEAEVSNAIFALIKPGMIVLDIGANIGIHTLHMARRVGRQGRVLAFEPNVVVREELEKNISINKITNVSVLKVALWERGGEETFYFPEDGMEAMGGLKPNSRFKVASEAKVETARLDSVLAQLNIRQVDFIKIDVEGAELNVLKGAGSLLDDNQRPPIMYEANPSNSLFYSYTPDELHQFLRAKNYEVENLCEDNYLALPRCYS